MKKAISQFLKVILFSYVIICVLLYFFQEKFIFHPDKLDKSYDFRFDTEFKELAIRTPDGKDLNAVLFQADSSRGVVFYLHGNAGSIDSWGNIAETYTRLKYDLFMLDYRGYGKSEGSIRNTEQLFEDIQSAYDSVKKFYSEEKIVILGYSIGTGLAAKLASTNKPKQLILQAPYYNLKDLMTHTFPIIPTFILKYNLETDKYIKDINAPIVIFHGDRDEVIYYGSSLKLKKLLKNSDTLITLIGQGRNGMSENQDYRISIEKMLN